MALIPWRTKRNGAESRELAPVSEFRHEVNRLFDQFFRDPFGETAMTAWAPALDIAETDQEITVRAEVPGIDPKDLDISVTGDRLVLSGEKKESTEHKDKGLYHSESYYGSFRRSVELPTHVDTNKVDANYKQGVLTIHLKKDQAAAPKRIQVKAS